MSLGTIRKPEVATESLVIGVERKSVLFSSFRISNCMDIFFLFVGDVNVLIPKWEITEMLGLSIFKEAVNLKLLGNFWFPEGFENF